MIWLIDFPEAQDKLVGVLELTHRPANQASNRNCYRDIIIRIQEEKKEGYGSK
jgi:hypothetical protein